MGCEVWGVEVKVKGLWMGKGWNVCEVGVKGARDFASVVVCVFCFTHRLCFSACTEEAERHQGKLLHAPPSSTSKSS